MDLAINLLTVAEVIVSLLLVLIVLMQRPKQEGLGAAFGEAVMNQSFGVQTTNVLQKGTTFFGILLFVLTITLATLVARQNSSAHKPSLIGAAAQNAPKPAAPAPVAPAPAATGAPAAPAVEIKPAPSAPAAPVTPAPAKPADSKPAAPAPAAPVTPAPAPAPAGQPK
jgi:preprotein translocase subunit SecG